MSLGVQRSRKFSDLETKITRLLARLDNLKRQKQDNLQLLQDEKGKLLKEIRCLRKKVNDKLDGMEKTLVNGMDTKIGARARDIHKDLDVINNELLSLEERKKSLHSATIGNHTEQFIQLKMVQSLVQEHKRMFRSISTGINAVNMQVLPSNTITTLLQTDDAALGSTSEIPIPILTTYNCDANVRLPSDKKTCFIFDICLTLNGDIYITDSNNSRIKKLNESCTVTEHIVLPAEPFGLCELEYNRLAVTLPDLKKVQFLFLNPMFLGKSFSVGDICKGIDCHNSQLYVCCGGWGEVEEGPGRIEVYNMGGELLRVYYHGASCPGYIQVSDRGDLLISNDDRESLVTLWLQDHSVSNLMIKALSGPRGMFRLSESLIGVAGLGSNNIVLISEDGKHQQELLTEKDGISKPNAVCFDRQRFQLIVICSGSDNIKFFKLTT